MRKITRALLALIIAGAATAYGQPNNRPNIIVILADDMGYSDIGCFGSEIETPNLDRLAASGVKLSQFYNSARCCPTRASLLTGQYPHMAGMGWMTVDRHEPGYRGNLSQNCATFGEALKPAGYMTYAVGKWHVTPQTKYDGDKSNWPLQRGFDKYFGIIPGAANYFAPVALTNGNTKVKPGKSFYLTDAIADSASSFINSHAGSKINKPFFMYVAFNAPHWPLQAKPEDIKKYENRYANGWDKLREARYNKQLAVGLIDKTVNLTPRDPKIPAWNDLPPSERQLWIKRMAVYAAQVDCLDQNVGKIMNSLRKAGLSDNTLVMFMADNGACAEAIKRTDIPVDQLGTVKSFESYHINWANASNTPFKLYKHYVHEGGISSPFIASWPKHIRPSAQVKTTPGHVMDIMPTIMDAAQANYPSQVNGHDVLPMAGQSLLPVFDDKPFQERALFWEHEANRAVRYQNWKLVSLATDTLSAASGWELYDMAKDRAETHNLASKHPDVVEKLSKLWDEWAKANQVYPLYPHHKSK